MFGWFQKLFGGAAAGAPVAPPNAPAYGIGGHGLLLSVPVDTRALIEPDGSLTLERGGALVRVIPGEEAATAAPTFDGQRWSTGPGGPHIASAAGQSGVDQVLLRTDVGLGPSPWMALLGGAWVEPPPCFTLFTGTGHFADTEWHASSPERGVFFSLQPRAVEPAEVVIRPAANQSQSNEGVLGGTEGAVRWVEMAYEHGGESWRQRFYVAPWPGGSVLGCAQAPLSQAPFMWAALEHALYSLEPT